MKTKNNIQKTALKTVAAATGLAILSFTVNAQGSLKSLFENNEINHIAMVMEKTSNTFVSNNTRSFTDAEVYVTYLTEETEEPLTLENWMVEEINFVMSAEVEAETESPLEVEDWMKSENTFEVYSALLKSETEEALNLEDWMINENSFKAAFNIKAETENPLQVEDWMTNENTFEVYSALLETETEEELMPEEWMMNENTFANNQNVSTVTKTSSTPISTSTFFYREVNIEEKLEIENWMINPKIWGK